MSAEPGEIDRFIVSVLVGTIDNDIDLIDGWHWDENPDKQPRDLLDSIAMWSNTRFSEDVANRLHDLLGIPHAPERIFSEVAAQRAALAAEQPVASSPGAVES